MYDLEKITVGTSNIQSEKKYPFSINLAIEKKNITMWHEYNEYTT
jgi:hypothetical protein